MKTLALLLVTATALHADPRFVITKTTIDGGGARSTQTRFTLTGTIGQPEAAPQFSSPNGRFSIEPGFWDRYTVVQTPGLPLLTIRRGIARDTAVLAWPVVVSGYVLEQSPELSPASWSVVLTPVVDTATEHTVTVPIDAPKKFFRLRAP
jgi:hypothetical protein